VCVRVCARARARARARCTVLATWRALQRADCSKEFQVPSDSLTRVCSRGTWLSHSVSSVYIRDLFGVIGTAIDRSTVRPFTVSRVLSQSSVETVESELSEPEARSSRRISGRALSTLHDRVNRSPRPRPGSARRSLGSGQLQFTRS